MTTDKWYDDAVEYRKFTAAMVDAGGFPNSDEFSMYLIKPWKWNAEHQEWVSFDNPMDEEDETWDEWAEYLEGRD